MFKIFNCTFRNISELRINSSVSKNPIFHKTNFFLLKGPAKRPTGISNRFSGAFRLYDIDQNGSVSKTEMLQIVNAIFSLTGQINASAEQRVSKIFDLMDTVSKKIDNIDY